MTEQRPRVALLPAGDRFEDFFDKVGVTLETFRQEQTGGWLFNYVEALDRADCDTVVVYMSARISSTLRFVHEPTGCGVSVLPSPVATPEAPRRTLALCPQVPGPALAGGVSGHASTCIVRAS